MPVETQVATGPFVVVMLPMSMVHGPPLLFKLINATEIDLPVNISYGLTPVG